MKIKYKIFTIMILIVQILSLFSNMQISFASIKEGDIVNLKGDHECDSVLEYWMEDYQKWSYKIVWYVYYEDSETKEKYPAFCVEPQKEGVGTGYDSYDVMIKNENDNRIWRVLNKGYMGSTYQEWNLECDDDFYSATKVALHSISEGIAPKDKYILGNRSVDGNTVEEIQRRGAKVLDVAQSLYEYGINGTETYVSPKVRISKQGESKIQNIDNTSYYIQNYKVTGNKNLKSYKVEITNFPEGTKILNFNNQEINLNNLIDTNFKVAIPTNQIKHNIKGSINIKDAKIKTNPIFYCKSSIEEAQSYVTYTSGYEVASTSIYMDINANNCTLQIQKIDKEKQKPIANVKFKIQDIDGQDIVEVTTDKNGIAKISDLKPQVVTIKEIYVPEPYILSSEEKKVELEFNTTSKVVFENERKKGNLKIIKVDKDNKEIKLDNVEFDLLDKNGKFIKKLTTNEEGVAYVSNLDIGRYIIKEVKTKEGYNTTQDRVVEIKWNETYIETIENEKQKGNIEIIKRDKDNKNIKIENVVFEILDENKKYIDTIITDKNGYAIREKLPIGTYYIREIKTKDEYLLNKNLIKLEVKNEETYFLTVTNEKIKGNIKITKISEDDNLINGNKKGMPIEGVEFQIRKENGEIVQTLITDKDGIAISKDLEKGKYIIKETKSNEDYIINEEEFVIEITENNKQEEVIITNISKKPELPKLPRTGF